MPRYPDKKEGTKFLPMRITNQRLLRTSKRTGSKQRVSEAIMDAKWNRIIDNLSVRATLLVLGFGAWLVISYSLLAL